eukprot:2707627-Prorocentrum_lima.AAC.1
MVKTEGKVCLRPASSSSNEGLPYKSPPNDRAPLKAAPASKRVLRAAIHNIDWISKAWEQGSKAAVGEVNWFTDTWNEWRLGDTHGGHQGAPAKQRR